MKNLTEFDLKSLLAIFAIVLLAGCYGGDLESEKNRTADSSTGLFSGLTQRNTGKVDIELVKAEPVDSTPQGAASSPSRLLFAYTLSATDAAALPAGARIVLTLLDAEGNTVAVSPGQAIPAASSSGTASGEIVMIVPQAYATVNAIATIEVDEQLSGAPVLLVPDANSDLQQVQSQVESQPQGLLVNIPLSYALAATNLGNVSNVTLELVPDTYSSVESGLRRVHRFAVRAYDQECVSIRGLGSDIGKFFTMEENSIHDVESPVTYDSRDNHVRVYMVLDASSSITYNEYPYDNSGQAQVQDAVEYTALQMPDNYVLDYRQFNGDVKKLDHYTDYDPDESQSATAFYYAIDTVLDDIENQGDSEDYHVIIAFTDGLDLSSRNHYGRGYTHETVKQHVRQRVETYRSAPGVRMGKGLEVYTVSVGSTAETDVENLRALASVGGGTYTHADKVRDLEGAFAALADRVLATYHLEYDSQQRPDDSELELQFNINEQMYPLVVRRGGGYDPVPVEHDCSYR